MSALGNRPTLSCRVPVGDVVRRPNGTSKLATQLVHGEEVTILAEARDWCEVETVNGMTGFVRADELWSTQPPSHMVCVQRAFVYLSPNSLSGKVCQLSLGSRVVVDERKNDFLHIRELGWVFETHLCQMEDRFASDPVDFALLLLHTPYLYGGRSAFGVDCSGLVDFCFALLDVVIPRSRDGQLEASVPVSDYRRGPRKGDLVFFSHHVGFMLDETNVVHCGSPDRRVSIQSLEWALNRYVDERGRTFLGVRSIPRPSPQDAEPTAAAPQPL